MSKEGLLALRQICFLFNRNGIFSGYAIGTGGKIKGDIAGTPHARRFVTGTWLERCVKEIVQDFLNLQPARIGCMQNICGVRPDGRKFELDTLLMIDEEIYWIESKSGDYQMDDILRYATIGKMLALPDDRIYVVAGNVSCAADPAEIRRNHGIRVINPIDLFVLVENLESQYLKPKETGVPVQPK